MRLSTFITMDNQEHSVVRYGVKFLNWHWLLGVVLFFKAFVIVLMNVLVKYHHIYLCGKTHY
jgi:hypothetical protein